MKRRLLPAALMLALAFSLIVPAHAESFDPATRESVAVVATCLDTEGGEVSFGWGTGFFVGQAGEDPGYLVTNHHVIEDFIEYGEGELYDYTIGDQTYRGRTKIRVYYDSSTYEEAYVVEYSSAKDVAILKLAGTTSLRKPIPLAVPDDGAVGSVVFAVGYPGLSENLFAGATSSWGVSDVTVTRGAVSRMLTTQGTGQAIVQIDCDIKHGNSGGPLVNAAGQAIGITTKSVSNVSGEQANYAVNISEAITLLDRNSVAYTVAGAASDPAGGPSEAADAPGNPAPAPGGISTGVIIGVAAAAAAVVAAVVLALRKKKPASQTADTSGAQAVPAVGSGEAWRLQCTSGAFAGRRFAINGQLRIGRDPARNDLVYPASAQGISGAHCVLRLQGGTLWLEDLGSSYGTFMADGRKLAPHQPLQLRKGESFYLASQRESFQITGKGGV